MNGWLRNASDVIPLSNSHPTTIGRECCDVVVQCSAVDNKHATIEYDDAIGCFVLQDLGTVFGTYINGCQIRNSMVHLRDGDVIKIGFGPTAVQYEFNTDSGCNCCCQHHVTGKDLYCNIKERPFSSSQTSVKTFSHLPTASPCASSPIESCASVNMPRASCQSSSHVRPSSTKSTTSKQLSFCDGVAKRAASCVVHDEMFCKDNCGSRESAFKVDNKQTCKKVKEILEQNDELRRLRRAEVESLHKDCRIKELHDQIDRLQIQLSQAVSNGSNRIEVESLQRRNVDLENQLQMRIDEMADLNEQIFNQKANSQKQLNDLIQESNCLKEELEKLRKDKNILSGLLTQVQKDISMKDMTICRLTKDVERKSNELSDKDVQLASFQSIHSTVSKHKLLQSNLEQKQKEVDAIAEKIKALEGSIQKKDVEIAILHKTLDKTKVGINQDKQQLLTMKKNSNELTTKLGEMENANKMASKELVDLNIKVSKFRLRIQRMLSLRCSLNNLEAFMRDEENLTDDQIIEQVKQTIEENGNLTNQLAESKKKCDELESDFRQIVTCGERLKSELNASTGATEPTAASLLVILRQELNAVQMLVTLPSLRDFQQLLASMIQVQLKWQSEMVSSMESIGINVRLSDATLCKHISDLHAKCEESVKHCLQSKVELEMANLQFKRDLEEARDRGRKEMEERSQEKLEKLVQESEMKFEKEKEAVAQKEKANYEEQITHEQLKLVRLEEQLRCIEKAMAEKTEELNLYKEQEKQHMCEIEAYRRVENELREEILDRKWERRQARASFEQSLRKKHEQEMASLKEQTAHLSTTLASTQERLSKANNRVHRQQLEIASLKSGPSLSSSACAAPANGYEPKASFEVSQVNEKLRDQVKKLQADLKKATSEVSQRKGVISTKTDTIADLEKQLQATKTKLEQATSQGSSSELLALGAKCKKEQHEDTILKQGKAMVELRKRIRNLMKGSFTASQSDLHNIFIGSPLSAEAAAAAAKGIKSSHSVIQSGSLLKIGKEQSSTIIPVSSRSNVLEKTVNKTASEIPFPFSSSHDVIRGLNSPSKVDDDKMRSKAPFSYSPVKFAVGRSLPTSPINDAAVPDHMLCISNQVGMRSPVSLMPKVAEKSFNATAKADVDRVCTGLQENLEMSEQAYACLLKTITEALSIDKVINKVPILMEEAKNSDKKLLNLQRQNACQEIQMELHRLRDKMADYESTVRRYDIELTRLRNSDILLEQKGWQIDGLTSDVRSLVDEVACLHESLMKVREELRREKQKNAVPRDRKIWTTTDRTKMGTTVRHSCYPNNAAIKTKERSKSSDRLKRKEYEVLMLKEELRKCEKNMERVGHLDYLLSDSNCSRSDLIGISHHCNCSKTSI